MDETPRRGPLVRSRLAALSATLGAIAFTGVSEAVFADVTIEPLKGDQSGTQRAEQTASSRSQPPSAIDEEASRLEAPLKEGKAVAVEAPCDTAIDGGKFAPRDQYQKKRALGLSLGTTLGGIAAGGALLGLSFAATDRNYTAFMALSIGGASIAGLAFLIGPSLGHFYVKNNKQAAWDLVLRTLFAGGAFGLIAGGFASAFAAGMCNGYSGIGDSDNEEDDCPTDHSGILITFGMMAATASLVLAVVDLATTVRAVERANELAGKKVSDMTVSPTISRNPNGAVTAGLSFSMRF